MLETLIHQAILQIPSIQAGLARYNGAPAVFWRRAPNAFDPGWEDGAYPRLECGADWQGEPERDTAGRLLISLWCTDGGTVEPEPLAADLRAALSGLFLTDESGSRCMAWSSRDYAGKRESEPNAIGLTLRFDVLAFPPRETAAPDPVWGMDTLLGDLLPEARRVGRDALPALWRPARDSPAVYVRPIENVLYREAYACTWMRETLGIHLLAPGAEERRALLHRLAGKLGEQGMAVLEDGSPCFIRQIKCADGADPIRAGQMTVTAEYGVLTAEPDAPVISRIQLR